MKPTLLLIFIAFSSCIFAQEETRIIGDIRYDDDVYTILRYRPTVKIDLSVYDSRDSLVVIKLLKKEKYDNPGGTRILFDVPTHIYRSAKKSTFSKTLKMDCVFHYLSRKTNNPTSSKVVLEADLGDIDVLSDKTISLGQPIRLNAPERFTLTMIMNDIEEDFSSSKRDGYSKAISILDNNFSRYYERDIQYETMIDFYKLLIYTEKYVSENSFFNKEAQNLKDTIIYLGKQLQEFNDDKMQLRNEILHEYVNSTEVYEDYQRVYARIKDYNSRLKLILLYRSR